MGDSAPVVADAAVWVGDPALSSVDIGIARARTDSGLNSAEAGAV